ncbi:GmrSD restriction endonuclease domain-containing protein [Candidatus Thiodictyon syntrophicum]|nr:DUF262 domain-containing protein [Candidatus Thiodictyon syntrophicum]
MDPKTRRRRGGDPADRPAGGLSWPGAQINRVRCKNGEFCSGRRALRPGGQSAWFAADARSGTARSAGRACPHRVRTQCGAAVEVTVNVAQRPCGSGFSRDGPRRERVMIKAENLYNPRMIAVDTSALMATLLDEQEADAWIAALETADEILISAGTVTEALIVSARLRGNRYRRRALRLSSVYCSRKSNYHATIRGPAMSSQQTLKQFFAVKVLEIPRYQRSYAWENQNVRELFEDIKEAIETKSQHYLGTVVLSKTHNPGVYTVVDGQQRLTTLLMFIASIIRKLPKVNDQEFYHRLYINDGETFKLTPLERDRDFYFQLLDLKPAVAHQLEPRNKSQRLLLNAFEEIENLTQHHIPDPRVFLASVEALSLLEFIEKDESDAIRIFQTVNDRGRELSRMDKMKSLLFYFSDKYLDRKYDDEINRGFAEIFELYDEIKLIAERQSVNVLSSKQFAEDDLLRHHHICFSEESYDPTGQEVLDNVKRGLYELRKGKNAKAQLDEYISAYLESLVGYVKAFSQVVRGVEQHGEYYKLFSIQGLSAVLYPVIAQLEKCGFLDQLLPKRGVSVLRMLEVIDLRVFKVREYAGRKHVAEFSFRLNNEAWSIQEIEDHLVWFNAFEIGDARFKDYLTNFDYYKQTGLLRALFVDYCESLRGQDYSLTELQSLMEKNPTIEHILSQSPRFKPKSFGFSNDQDFEEHLNLLGNLTLLEKKLNSSAQNADLGAKASVYAKSTLKMTSSLGTDLATLKVFGKKELAARGRDLADDLAKRWPA